MHVVRKKYAPIFLHYCAFIPNSKKVPVRPETYIFFYSDFLLYIGVVRDSKTKASRWKGRVERNLIPELFSLSCRKIVRALLSYIQESDTKEKSDTHFQTSLLRTMASQQFWLKIISQAKLFFYKKKCPLWENLLSYLL